MMLLSISENFLLFLSGIGTVQGILLALLLYFHPRSDKSVTIFLALYITSLSISATIPLIERLVTWQKSFFVEPFPLLAGPLLYLYIRSFKERLGWKKVVPHLISFFAFFFLTFWFFKYMSARFPHSREVPAEALRDPYAVALGSFRIAQLVLYYILSRRALAGYRRSIRQLFSETSRIDLAWIKWLINGLLFLVLISIITYSFMLQYPQHFDLFQMIQVAILAPYIYLATYKGITQPSLWQVQAGTSKEQLQKEIREADEFDIQQTSEKSKVPKPILSNEKMKRVVAKILFLMEEEKLYLETELTLQELADRVEAPAYQISQAINEGLNKNFYDLINAYRVDEAKQLLLNPTNSNFTILSVAFEAGFNSKTTFNTVFKKFTGLTPTDFRAQRKLEMTEA
jgi:AraC-like DNA-binding protein